MKSGVILFFVFFSWPLVTAVAKCDSIANGRYKVEFETKGFEGFELLITDGQFTKLFKDGTSAKGTLEWRSDCIFILKADSGAAKEKLEEEIEAGLGVMCMQIVKKKGRTTFFKTTRAANLNIVINEGKLIKLK